MYILIDLYHYCFLFIKYSSKSFKNSENKIGDRFFPLSHSNITGKIFREMWLIWIILILGIDRLNTGFYIMIHTFNYLKNLPLTLYLSNLCLIPTRQTESKALLKSIYVQNIFFLWWRRISIIECKVNMWSVVLWCLRNPAWFSFKILFSSFIFSRAFNTEVNNLLTQDNTVIGR